MMDITSTIGSQVGKRPTASNPVPSRLRAGAAEYVTNAAKLQTWGNAAAHLFSFDMR